MFGVSDNAVRKWIKFGKQYESWNFIAHFFQLE
jgi:hypothetical protein